MATQMGNSTEMHAELLGLPPCDQVGFVVRDLQAAMAMYAPLFGPFSTMDGSVKQATYRGRLADAGLQIAFGRSGNLEIELIEWTGGESPHREFIEAGHARRGLARREPEAQAHDQAEHEGHHHRVDMHGHEAVLADRGRQVVGEMTQMVLDVLGGRQFFGLIRHGVGLNELIRFRSRSPPGRR